MFISLLECDAAKMSLQGQSIHEQTNSVTVNSITGLLFVAAEDIRPGSCALIVKSTEVSFPILLSALKALSSDSEAALIAFTSRKPGSTSQFGLHLNGADDFGQATSCIEDALSRASHNQNAAELYTSKQVFEQTNDSLKPSYAKFVFGAQLFDGAKGIIHWSSSVRERSLRNGRIAIRWKIRTLVRPEGIQTLSNIYTKLHSDAREFPNAMIVFTYEKEGLQASIVVNTSVDGQSLTEERKAYEAKLLKAISEAI